MSKIFIFISNNKLQLLFFLSIIIALISGWLSTSGHKSQFIRLVDIFIIGPLMIYIGYINYSRNVNDYYSNSNYISNSGSSSRAINNILYMIPYIILAFFGATTITYNLKNYIAKIK